MHIWQCNKFQIKIWVCVTDFHPLGIPSLDGTVMAPWWPDVHVASPSATPLRTTLNQTTVDPHPKHPYVPQTALPSPQCCPSARRGCLIKALEERSDSWRAPRVRPAHHVVHCGREGGFHAVKVNIEALFGAGFWDGDKGGGMAVTVQSWSRFCQGHKGL